MKSKKTKNTFASDMETVSNKAMAAGQVDIVVRGTAFLSSMRREEIPGILLPEKQALLEICDGLVKESYIVAIDSVKEKVEEEPCKACLSKDNRIEWLTKKLDLMKKQRDGEIAGYYDVAGYGINHNLKIEHTKELDEEIERVMRKELKNVITEN